MNVEQRKTQHPLIAHLHWLADQDDRGALARLRRGLGKNPGSDTGSFPDVIPYLSESEVRGANWPFFLVASLFAQHHRLLRSIEGDGLGRSLGRISDNPSSEVRFRALINAHVDDLPRHLQQVMSLLAAKSGAVDWGRLLSDLRRWDRPERRVQQAWSQQFWSREHQDRVV